MTELQLAPTSMAAGGEAVARADDGRVVFVRGAIPGDRVVAELGDERRSFARAEVVAVLDAGPGRRQPPCPEVAAGCGGCDWQHAEPSLQQELRRQIVTDALQRLGGIDQPIVNLGPELASEGYRTTVRCTVSRGRAGFRRRSSHESLAIDGCLVAHPRLSELIVEGRFGEAREVTLRLGERTGERLALVHPTADGVSLPDDVTAVGTDQLAAGHRAWYHEVVAGRSWRISASSFFQCRPDGAEALVEVASNLIAAHARNASSMVDLCAGVGLFSGALGEGRQVVAVERHKPAVADARHNLADRRVRLVQSSFERWRPSPAEIVVADPARSGLGRKGVAAAAATGAGLIVLVSCDPAALGRDAKLLAGHGFELATATVVDMFPNTSHVETVAGFVR